MGIATYFYLGLAIMAGVMASLQGAINGQLGHVLDNTLLAAFVSFAVGTIALFGVLLVRSAGSPVNFQALPGVSPVLLAGGVLGAAYVTIITLVVPKIGLTNAAVALILGQVLLSLLLDHFGIFGFDVRSISWSRVSGAALVIMGMALVVR